MASAPELNNESGRLGSLELSDSTRPEMRSNAAAWMWHTHMSRTSVKNEFLRLQYGQRQAAAIDAAAWKSCKRRSSSCDRKEPSRFRQGAGANVLSPPPRLMKEASQPSTCGGGWDCGSELYDTFELVSFSNRLDRSLLGVPALEDPLHHSSVGNLRTLSLPRTLSLQATPNFEMAPSVHGSVDASTNHGPCWNAHVQGSLVAATKSKSSTYLAKWLAKFVTKVVSIHGQNIWCFKPFLLERVEETSSAIGGGMPEEQRERYRVYEEKVKDGHKHFHHHHHHYYHHHFLHHLDQSTQDAELHNCKPSITSPRAESARLSFETMSKICADKNWL